MQSCALPRVCSLRAASSWAQALCAWWRRRCHTWMLSRCVARGGGAKGLGRGYACLPARSALAACGTVVEARAAFGRMQHPWLAAYTSDWRCNFPRSSCAPPPPPPPPPPPHTHAHTDGLPASPQRAVPVHGPERVPHPGQACVPQGKRAARPVALELRPSLLVLEAGGAAGWPSEGSTAGLCQSAAINPANAHALCCLVGDVPC